MAILPSPASWYDSNATILAPSYAAVDPEKLYDWLKDFLPPAPGLVLDLGAGIGRDAAWLAALGYDVFAVEPSAAMRAEGGRRYPDPAIQWIDDRLPALASVYRLGFAFDVILLGAVWQHVAPGERERTMRKMLGLLRPGGILALTLRHGPAEAERGMNPVSLAEVEQFARGHGALVARVVEMPDHLHRPEVSWTGVVLRLPDDGTGALPLLRHIILNDQKSATYKLGLLRALCRAADGQAGMAVNYHDDAIVLPLGVVALNWLRLYLPLVAANLPQAPGNAGPAGLGFAGDGFRALMGGIVPRLDLRIGTRFSGAAGVAIAKALQEAADLIARMPAKYMTYPDGGCILIAKRRLSPRSTGDIVLNAAFLAGFGTLQIPRHLWHALGRFASWVEPALISEWLRVMKAYALRQNRELHDSTIGAAMTWSEPDRDVALARERASALLDAGQALHCVWSGRRLDAATLDIDHCLPWSAWPCGDLWNLLPAHRRVNQHQKRDRLPGDALLRTAGGPIRAWWQRAYLDSDSPLLPRRFADEASASLPGLGSTITAPSEEVFAALRVQRLRLRQDQQVPEWTG